ncbi:MAG TPA: hypothetical protein VMR41_02900 [Patescibacteria group bacterium]|nr:hypothetical protein [Patescibacteria group bacterium]
MSHGHEQLSQEQLEALNKLKLADSRAALDFLLAHPEGTGINVGLFRNYIETLKAGLNRFEKIEIDSRKEATLFGEETRHVPHKQILLSTRENPNLLIVTAMSLLNNRGVASITSLEHDPNLGTEIVRKMTISDALAEAKGNPAIKLEMEEFYPYSHDRDWLKVRVAQFSKGEGTLIKLWNDATMICEVNGIITFHPETLIHDFSRNPQSSEPIVTDKVLPIDYLQRRTGLTTEDINRRFVQAA